MRGSATALIFIFSATAMLLLGCPPGEAPTGGDESSQVPAQSGSALKADISVEEVAAELEERIPELMEAAMIPGLSIALIRDGKVAWHEAFGVKDAESREPVSSSTMFEAASLSKPVFASAVLKFADRGGLELDTPLVDYVPLSYLEETFMRGRIEDERFGRITARLVLTHTPGFPNWRVNRGGAIEFVNDPGTRFGYSGEGFVLLQRVVEKITGSSLNDFVSEYVFEPLGMIDSSYVEREGAAQQVVTRHDLRGNPAGKPQPGGGGNAAASLLTTARDYAKFLAAVMAGEGLAEATARAMLEPQVEVGGEANAGLAWGLGIGLQSAGGTRAVWHWGDNFNSKAYFVAYPAEKIGVVYFANSFYGLAIAAELVPLAVGGEHPVFTSSFFDDYSRYDSEEGRVWFAYVKDGPDRALELYAEWKEDPPRPDSKIREPFLNALGYDLMRLEDFDGAVRVFKLNVEAYSDSWNVYDSLGEAYAKRGDKDLAIASYRKSLELNPDNRGGAAALRQLEGQ